MRWLGPLGNSHLYTLGECRTRWGAIAPYEAGAGSGAGGHPAHEGVEMRQSAAYETLPKWAILLGQESAANFPDGS